MITTPVPRIRLFALCALVAAFVAGSEAEASTYDVQQCTNAQGGADYVVDNAAGAGYQFASSCGFTNGYLELQVGPTAPNPAAYKQIAFAAPNGTRFNRVTGRNTRAATSGNGILSYVFARRTAGGGEQTVGGINTGSVSENFDTNAWSGPAAPLDRIGVGLTCSKSAAQGQCGLQFGQVTMTNLNFAMEDTVAPATPQTSGSILGGWVNGSKSVTINGSDTGAGVAATSTWVNGSVVDIAAPCSPDLTRLRPCPLTGSDSTTMNVASAPFTQGNNQLQTCVGEYGTNSQATCKTETVQVDTIAPTAPSTPALPGGSGWRRDNDFDLSWNNPAQAHAPIVGATVRLTPASGGASVDEYVAGSNVQAASDVDVPGPGQWTARVFLRDAAGNEAAANSSSTTLRFDDVVPAEADPEEANGWLNRGDVAGGYVQEWAQPEPGQIPPSGIAGYRGVLDEDGATDPCAGAPDSRTCAGPITEPGLTNTSRVLGGDDLDEGSNFFHVAAISGSGMRATDVGHTHIRVDETDPDTVLNGEGDGGWVNHAVQLRAVASDALSGMVDTDAYPLDDPPATSIVVDGVTTSDTDSNVSKTVTGEGPHSVSYFARDLAGNTETASNTTVRIDTIAPTEPEDLDVAQGSDWRRDDEFDLSWSNPPQAHAPIVGATVRLTPEDGGPAIQHYFDDPSIESVDDVDVPEVGEWTAEVFLRDAAGNQLLANAADAQLRFDDTVPAKAQPEQPDRWLNGSDLDSGYAAEWSQPASPPSGIDGYRVAVNGNSDTDPCAGASEARTCGAPVNEPGADNTSRDLDRVELSEGTNYIHVAPVSGSGMRGTDVGHAAIKVDETAPETTLEGAPSDWVNHDVSLQAIGSDGLSGMTDTDDFAGDGPPATYLVVDGVESSNSDSNVSANVTGDGVHDVNYYARDLAGNEDVPSTEQVRIDTVAPDEPEDLQSAQGGGWQRSEEFALSWTNPTQVHAPIVGATVRLTQDGGGAAVEKFYADPDVESVDVEVPAPGEWSADVFLRDAAGNELQANAAEVELRFDDTEPAEFDVVDPTSWISRGELADGYEQRWSRPQHGPSGIDGYAVGVDHASGSDPCGSDDCSGDVTERGIDSRSRELGPADLDEGDNYVHVVPVSGAGIRAEDPGEARLAVDLTDPEADLELGSASGWSNQPLTLRVHGTDALSGMGAGEFSGDRDSATAIVVDGERSSDSDGEVAVTVGADGEHAIEYWARDVAGNKSASESATVRVDRTGPALGFPDQADATAPYDVVASIGDPLSGVAGGQLSYREVGSSSWTDLQTGASGGELRAELDGTSLTAGGAYQVRAAGSDNAGNASSVVAPYVIRVAADQPPPPPAPPVVGTTPSELDIRINGASSADVGYEGRAILGGRLKVPAGEPDAAGAEVQITQRFAKGSKPAVVRRVTTTDGIGRFEVALQRGPSRMVTAAFAGDERLKKAVSSGVELDVRGRVKLRAPRMIARGSVLALHGRISTRNLRLGERGKRVLVQVRERGEGWALLGRARSSRHGSFRLQLRDLPEGRYKLRAIVPVQRGYAYMPTKSKKRSVTVQSRTMTEQTSPAPAVGGVTNG